MSHRLNHVLDHSVYSGKRKAVTINPNSGIHFYHTRNIFSQDLSYPRNFSSMLNRVAWVQPYHWNISSFICLFVCFDLSGLKVVSYCCEEFQTEQERDL